MFLKKKLKKSQSVVCAHIKMSILSLLRREKYLAAQMIMKIKIISQAQVTNKGIQAFTKLD